MRGLRGASDFHWIRVWGIIDNDQRSASEVEKLKQGGVWALTHYSVEAIYYHPQMIERVASRQSAMLGDTVEALRDQAIASALEATRLQRDHLVAGAIMRSVRRQIGGSLPTRKELFESDEPFVVEVDVQALRAKEESHFDKLVEASAWDGLLIRYPLRESPAFDRIADGLKLKNKAAYQAAVLKLLQDCNEALTETRTLLGDLCTQVEGTREAAPRSESRDLDSENTDVK